MAINTASTFNSLKFYSHTWVPACCSPVVAVKPVTWNRAAVFVPAISVSQERFPAVTIPGQNPHVVFPRGPR